MTTDTQVYIPLSEVLMGEDLPRSVLDIISPVTDRIAYLESSIIGDANGGVIIAKLQVISELALDLPVVKDLALVIGGGPVELQVIMQDGQFEVYLLLEELRLRFPRSWLQPVVHDSGGQYVLDQDVNHFAEITIPFGLRVTDRMDIELVLPGTNVLPLSFPAAMIGDTGIIIKADDILLRFSGNVPLPPGGEKLGDSWRGIFIQEAAIAFPVGLATAVPSNLKFQNCFIGTGGFSGSVTADWAPPLSGNLFGTTFALEHFTLTFVQNALTESDIQGAITLPFFDEPINVEIGVHLDGSLAVKLADPSGLHPLTKPDILTLTVDSLSFEVAHGILLAKLSGKVTPLFGKDQGLDWPGFQVKELAIDSRGNVHLEGGWLDLPNQYHFDFHGFHMEITKLGFGKTEDGDKWIGFSGGLKLVDGLSAAASVEGLRIIWYDDVPGQPHRDPHIALNGVGVEFEVPDVLRFKGAVSYRGPSGNVHRFDGSIKLELIALDMEIDGKLVVGSDSVYTFFAVYLDAELPAGIPLWSTGLALYGMDGLFALNFEPNRQPNEGWYAIGTPDWYHRSPVGVTDLQNKWTNKAGSLALGGGVTIGTVSDNGYSFSGKMLLVIVFPGPILLIEGRANMLKERARLSASDEATFRALAVLDSRAGTFTVGLDTLYRYDTGGKLIDIHGGAEAFFSLSDASAWHLFLGQKDPMEKRIRAEVFTIFESNAYLILDAHQLAMGAWTGYSKHWHFGPLSVTAEAWIEGNALISWKPVHLSGDLWLHGNVGLKVFGFGTTLSVDAHLAAEVFDPFDVEGDFSVKIKLPWHTYHADISLKWAALGSPPLPLPLKEVAVEHFKVTTSWPLPRDGNPPLLQPNYDRGDGFLLFPLPQPDPNAPPPPKDQLPVVPIDARPRLTFGRAVLDDAEIGVSGQPVVPEWEQIGDQSKNEGPLQIRYHLTEVTLDKYTGGGWVTVARKGTTPNAGNVRQLFGSWAPIPAMPDGNGQHMAQVKLWLWSKTPFDYTRRSSRTWDEWFTGRFQHYPCPPPASDLPKCIDFGRVDLGELLLSPWEYYTDPLMPVKFEWLHPLVLNVSVLNRPIVGLSRALCIPAANPITMSFNVPAKAVRIIVAEEEAGEVEYFRSIDCVDFRPFEVNFHGPNPWTVQGVIFDAYATDANDNHDYREDATQITTGGQAIGLDCRSRLLITLPQASARVELLLTYFKSPGFIEVFNDDGSRAKRLQMRSQQAGVMQRLTLTGRAIRLVVIHAPDQQIQLHQMCYYGPLSVPAYVIGTAISQSGIRWEVPATGNVIDIEGKDKDVRQVIVQSNGGGRICIVQVCADYGPNPAEVKQREEITRHLIEETARWSEEGEVLESHTAYRLKVMTIIDTKSAGSGISSYELSEFAYFRTEGPPALTQFSPHVVRPIRMSSIVG